MQCLLLFLVLSAAVLIDSLCEKTTNKDGIGVSSLGGCWLIVIEWLSDAEKVWEGRGEDEGLFFVVTLLCKSQQPRVLKCEA